MEQSYNAAGLQQSYNAADLQELGVLYAGITLDPIVTM